MRATRVWVIAATLASIGIAVLLYKHFVLEFPLSPDTKYNSWNVEARIDLYSTNPWKAGDKPLQLAMQLPHASDRLVLVDENIVARRFGHEVTEADGQGNRQVVFSKRRIDAQETLFYRAIVYELDAPAAVKVAAPEAPNSPYSKANRPKLEKGATQAPVYLAVDALIEEARERSASTRSFVREIFNLAKNEQDDRVRVIRDTVDAHMHTTQLSALLLQAADVPTRTAHGLRLVQDSRRGQFAEWLEVYLKDKWQPIDPESYTFGLKDKYIVWWYGASPFMKVEEGRARADSTVSVRHNTNDALTRAIWKSGQGGNFFLTFSFYNLPLDSQILFKVLLMIPVGGLTIAFLRQVIGVKTFGTFMPVLVALAFRETGLIAGIFFFVMVVALGLMIRNYFAHLKMLLVPRLAAVLTVVVLVLSILAMAANQLGLVMGLSISLFPIVILTMTIERMTLMWEEYGPKEALQTGFTSLFAAIIAFFMMNNATLSYLAFGFPELLLVVLALAMLLGRYNHYKLTEYIRFRNLQKSLMDLEKKEAAEKKAGE
jgi:hypothetical protein